MEELESERLKSDIHTIKNNLTTLGLKLELVYAALTGNEISKDEGLVGDIKGQKKALEKLTERVDVIEKKENKRQIYLHIIYGAIGFIIALILNYFFNK